MLALDRTGSGPPLVLLHGTNSSREVWAPVLPRLAAQREVLAFDLPGHGRSAPTAWTPPAWAREVAASLDLLGLGPVGVVGHSAGGWTALELAKLGRAAGVLALVPAGLWRRHSPLATDVNLVSAWGLARRFGRLTEPPLRHRASRAVALRQLSARPAAVPTELAVAAARTVAATRTFPAHFRRTRRERFSGGQAIPPAVPVHVVWGAQDRIARARRSRHRDELPLHATVETWPECGHMVMWDQPERLVATALAVPTRAASALPLP